MTSPAELVESRDLLGLRSWLSTADDVEVAEEIYRLAPQDQAIVFRLLVKERALWVFEKLDPAWQVSLLDALRADEVHEIMERLDPDDRAELLDEMPAKVARRLLARVSPDERERTGLLLGYSPDSAGRLMTPEFVSVRASETAAQGLERIRRADIPPESAVNLWVLDSGRRLVGIVSLLDLALADPAKTVEELMDTKFIAASTEDDQEDVARRIQDHDLLTMPIVDRENRLVGVVTVDDAMDVLQEENTEDITRLGGSQPVDRPYLAAGVFRIFRSRIGWLLVLFIAEVFTGTVIRAFEGALHEVVALSFFIPLLIGTGGNAGSQTSTTIIRSMAIGEVQFRDTARVVFKEVRVGLLLGGVMSAVGLVRALSWHAGGGLALTVGLSLICVVMLAVSVGSLLPIVLKRLRLDPAVVSAPFITTLVDALGLLIYFLIARALLGI